MANILEDVVPAKARKYVYAFITVAALAFGAWQASEGDVTVFIASLLAAATTLVATANTHTEPPADRDDYR